MILSDEQNKAIKEVLDWIKIPINTKQVFVFGGVSGSGKSSCIKYIKNELNLNTVEMVYTGQASLRMKELGNKDAKTIHSTIYNTVLDAEGKPRFTLKTREELGDIDLFIVDECSMINHKIFNDIISFKKKVLFVGDHKQLPPVKGNTILNNCDVQLNKCFRVALENPITWLSAMVRRGKFLLKPQLIGKEIMITKEDNIDAMVRADRVITTTHKKRIDINNIMRGKLNKNKNFPEVGDRVVCKKNMWKTKSFSPLLKDTTSLVNGMTGTILENNDRYTKTYSNIDGSFKNIQILNLDFKPDLNIETFKGLEVDWESLLENRKQSYKLDTKELNFFEYAYCLSLYSVQGSQYNNVYYDHVPFGSMETRKAMLYTAVTRAKEKLILKY